MVYGSICSGIEAATIAWEPLNWRPAFFAEIAAFPAAVLKQKWPHIPNLGDFTTITKEKLNDQKIDLLIGGTPCQSFSTSGNREGLRDPRGNLSLEYVKLAHRLNSKWIVWENVPGVLSLDKGQAFADILAMWSGQKIDPPKRWENAGIVAHAEGGYGLAWRVLDAARVRADGYEGGLPQGRRRLFLVGYLGDWRRAAEVLFNASTGDWDTEAKGEISASRRGENDGTVSQGTWCHDGGKINRNNRNKPTNSTRFEQCFTCITSFIHAVVYERNERTVVRHFTPREYERLMGFPDDHTRVKWKDKIADQCPDIYRYAACGNSMCVNVIRALGRRIDAVENAISNTKEKQ